MPASSSSMNSHSRVLRSQLTKQPAPCFLPPWNLPLQVMPCDIRICFPLPSARPSLLSPSYWLSSPSCMRKLGSWATNASKNECSTFYSFYFSSSMMDLRLLDSRFFLPVSTCISSNRFWVSSSMKPKTLYILSSPLESFSRISTQVRLLRGSTASLEQGLGAEMSYFLRLKWRSSILVSLVLISERSLLVRMTFWRRARLRMQKRLASSSRKKQRISQDLFLGFSRKRTPMRWFRQNILNNPTRPFKSGAGSQKFQNSRQSTSSTQWISRHFCSSDASSGRLIPYLSFFDVYSANPLNRCLISPTTLSYRMCSASYSSWMSSSSTCLTCRISYWMVSKPQKGSTMKWLRWGFLLSTRYSS